MADKQISSLPQAQTVDDSSLFVLEQQGTAMKASGAQWKGYAQDAVRQYVTQAQQQAQAAASSATQAANSATAAAASASPSSPISTVSRLTMPSPLNALTTSLSSARL